MEHHNKRFYIFTPADVCSGGPEALHQLAYYMRKLGMEAYTVYYTYLGFPEAQTIERYKQYEVEVVTFDEIEDEDGNYVIAPENAPWCLNSFKKAQKCIWWLSLHANEVTKGSFCDRVGLMKHRLLQKDMSYYRHVDFNPVKCWHLCGSKHTYLYVREQYKKSKVDYLVEPISLDFLKKGNADLLLERNGMVLYNPAKPSNIMKELLERGKFKYVPLKGFTPDGLAEMYKKAKLYVDFGEFGGPERMPKEAVYFGCNILVANHNAAANDFDVAIPQKYKVDDNETAEQIEKRIDDMLVDYEVQNVDFLPFKQKVEGLESNFMSQLENIFMK